MVFKILERKIKNHLNLTIISGEKTSCEIFIY